MAWNGNEWAPPVARTPRQMTRAYMGGMTDPTNPGDPLGITASFGMPFANQLQAALAQMGGGGSSGGGSYGGSSSGGGGASADSSMAYDPTLSALAAYYPAQAQLGVAGVNAQAGIYNNMLDLIGGSNIAGMNNATQLQTAYLNNQAKQNMMATLMGGLGGMFGGGSFGGSPSGYSTNYGAGVYPSMPQGSAGGGRDSFAARAAQPGRRFGGQQGSGMGMYGGYNPYQTPPGYINPMNAPLGWGMPQMQAGTGGGGMYANVKPFGAAYDFWNRQQNMRQQAIHAPPGTLSIPTMNLPKVA